MFTKLNQYLLTNHPLLWNTRVLQMLMVNAVLHILFYLGGFASIDAANLQERYYHDYSGGMITFSVLCSILVVVLWLVFYLRNNPLKSFYQLSKWHLVKEFGLILIVIFNSITFFDSFSYGERVKARHITPYAQLVQEVNTVNLAKAFIPIDKEDYFILYPCEDRVDNNSSLYASVADTIISNNNNQELTPVQKALRLPNAFCYQHYCKVFTPLNDSNSYVRNKQINRTVRSWLANHQKDSIKTIVERFITLCRKYHIATNIDAASLAQLPFADSNHTVTQLVGTNDYIDSQALYPYYAEVYPLHHALDFLDDCHTGSWNRNDGAERLLAELYCMMGLSILLLCYRRFSKKVFLISIVGSIVWCILIGLMGAGMGSATAVTSFYLLLFIVFTIIALACLQSKSSKTVAGITLSWHIYMLPALLMSITFLMVEHYNSSYGNYFSSEMHCRLNPISCWVDHNIDTIAWGNLIFSLLYVMFAFNRLAKKWHTMPDE